MKVAIVHDYLTMYGGGERMLELFHDLFPDATLFTILYDRKAMPDRFLKYDIRPSFLNRMPFKRKLFKYYVPLMPIAAESFNFSDYDLVISICSSFAKGIVTGIGTCHICYILTVPRFLWGYETSTQVHHQHNPLLPFVNSYLRVWDHAAADRPDFYIANAKNVQNRITKSYGRKSTVIYSPVDEEKFSLSVIEREPFYLIVSRLEPYKQVDLAIKASIKYKFKLKIIGDGSDRRHLEDVAQGSVDFLGLVDDEVVLRHYKAAKAVIFPGADDLGLVPIEAQMCGTPVVAYRKDGARETVTEGVSGVFFDTPDEESLYEALQKLDTLHLEPAAIRQTVMQFAASRVKSQLMDFITNAHKAYTAAHKL